MRANESRPNGSGLRDAGELSEPNDTPVTNLTQLTLRERTLWLEGYQWGRVSGLDDGYARGYAACDEEISHLQREAHRIVMVMAGLDPHRRAA